MSMCGACLRVGAQPAADGSRHGRGGIQPQQPQVPLRMVDALPPHLTRQRGRGQENECTAMGSTLKRTPALPFPKPSTKSLHSVPSPVASRATPSRGQTLSESASAPMVRRAAPLVRAPRRAALTPPARTQPPPLPLPLVLLARRCPPLPHSNRC